MDRDWTDATIELGPAGAMRVGVLRTQPAQPAPLVLHLHGGAFQGGSLEDGKFVARLLADAGAVVVSADYAPHAHFPTTQVGEGTLNADATPLPAFKGVGLS